MRTAVSRPFQVEGSVPNAHRVHGPPGQTTGGQDRRAAGAASYGSTRGTTFTGCESHRSAWGKAPRFGEDERKGKSGLEIRFTSGTWTGLHCLPPAGSTEVLAHGKLRAAEDASTAPYKGQSLYDHVPQKLEPGNTLTDPAFTLHTWSLDLL